MRQLRSGTLEEWLSKQLKKQISKLLREDWRRLGSGVGAIEWCLRLLGAKVLRVC
jgi:hypothetical protein